MQNTQLEAWAVEWQQEPGDVTPDVIAWIRSRPPEVQALMRRLPPACLVRGTRRLLCPAPGKVAFVYSYTEDGKVSVLQSPQGGIQGYCRPEWLEPVGYRYGLTPERVAAILEATP